MNIVSFIITMIRPFWPYFIGPLFVVIINALDNSLRPYLMKLIINALTMDPTSSTYPFHLIITAFIVLQFAGGLNWRLYDWCSLQYESALKNRIAKQCFEHLTLHDHHFFQNQFAGSLAAKINDIASLTPHILNILFIGHLRNLLSLLIAIVILWQVHAWFAVMIILWSAFLIFIANNIIGYFKSLTQAVAEANTKIIGELVDALSNITNIRFFAARHYELERLDKTQATYLAASKRRRLFILQFYSIQNISLSTYQSACLILLVYLHSEGLVTPGDFAMILTINLQITSNLWELSEQMRMFSENLGTIDQALKTLYAPLETQDKPHAKLLTIARGEIIFDNVCFHHKGDTPLFYNLSVRIPAGQKVGLVGYSGSGKTTFVNLILRLYDVTAGHLLIDNQDLLDLKQNSVRSHIGFIQQDPSLFHRTLYENIQYGRLDASFEEVVEAATRAHAHEFIMKLPEGYYSLVGERGVKLSGGQRQRIAIARAILKNAPILILDEATSQLDSVTELYIQNALWDLMQKKPQ